MEIETAIGENYHFALHDALLVYRGRSNTSFVTRHEIMGQDGASPVLGPAQPLTLSFVDSLVRSVRGNTKAEILPDNVLAKTDRMIAWWTPRRHRVMFYQNSEGKAQSLNGKSFSQPPLVWLVQDGILHIRALVENKRPCADTRLAVAPFWNLSSDGAVCTGSMRRPENASVAALSSWEQGFYESNFTHANVGRLTRHKGGFEVLWASLAGKRQVFPKEALIVLPETLSQFIAEGE
jgi:PRTRC genetic system protein B